MQKGCVLHVTDFITMQKVVKTDDSATFLKVRIQLVFMGSLSEMRVKSAIPGENQLSQFLMNNTLNQTIEGVLN